MAHNLNYNQQTGQYSFFSVKEAAWHGLGQIVKEYPNSKDALRFAGLAYEVGKLPNKHILPSGKEIVSDTSFFTYRADTERVLGAHVGRDYTVVQNADAFTFFDAIVGGEGGIQYETAGALGNGEKIFITAKMPDYIRVGNDDVIEKYVFLTTSHDGSGSIIAAFTPIRIVCNNTLNAALRNCSNVVKIRHTTGAQERLKEAHKVMGMVNKLSPMMEEIFNQWAKVRITDKEVQKLIQLAMCPNREVLNKLESGRMDELSTVFTNQCANAFEYAMMSDTQQMDTTKGTLFGAYNAVTGYFQNVRKYTDEESKMNSIIYGGTAQLRTQAAFNLCLDFAQNGTDVLQLN